MPAVAAKFHFNSWNPPLCGPGTCALGASYFIPASRTQAISLAGSLLFNLPLSPSLLKWYIDLVAPFLERLNNISPWITNIVLIFMREFLSAFSFRSIARPFLSSSNKLTFRITAKATKLYRWISFLFFFFFFFLESCMESFVYAIR